VKLAADDCEKIGFGGIGRSRGLALLALHRWSRDKPLNLGEQIVRLKVTCLHDTPHELVFSVRFVARSMADAT
jgi:hypothetical protein